MITGADDWRIAALEWALDAWISIVLLITMVGAAVAAVVLVLAVLVLVLDMTGVRQIPGRSRPDA